MINNYVRERNIVRDYCNRAKVRVCPPSPVSICVRLMLAEVRGGEGGHVRQTEEDHGISQQNC